MNRKVAIAVAAAAILLLWFLWPSRKITNRDSKGSAIVAFGDSLTAGYGANAGEDYPSHLSRKLGVPIINEGVNGDTTESAQPRLSAVLAHNPRIVILGLGGNDYLRGVPVATTEANLRSIIRQIHAGGAMVVLLGFNFPSLGANYGKMYDRVAEEERTLLVPDMLDGILSDPSKKSDDVHPNGTGYAVMAERVAGPLKRLMK
jgi:acyl-CoA thioesterase-1